MVDLEKEIKEIIESNIPRAVTIPMPGTGDNKRVYISKKVIKCIKEKEHEGGILPLAALIPLIMSVVGGAAGAAGGVAGVVQSAKESKKADAQKKLAEEELRRLKEEKKSPGTVVPVVPVIQKEPEKAAAGLFLDPYQGRGISDYLRNILKTSEIKNPEKKELKKLLKNL
jgi:hypothetical protein